MSGLRPVRRRWRGPRKNNNGLLRRYVPKSMDLSVRTREYLGTVAAELNLGPRKALDRDTSAERLATLLVAST